MLVKVIDNRSIKMAQVLADGIARCSDTRMAVAFVSSSGLEMILPAVSAAISAGASLEFLVGLDLLASEPQALRQIHELASRNPRVHLFCYSDLGPNAVYHPKVYILSDDAEVQCAVGSSNLTAGGLSRNVEVNALLCADKRDEAIGDILSTYNELKFDQRRVAPDDEFLAIYEELWTRSRKLRRDASKDATQRSLEQRLREKTKHLPRPQPARRDLYGWLELVYDLIPQGEFSTKDAYAIESACQEYYPDNRNIRPKIRQQLQVLAKMGLLEHLGTGRWRKL